MQPPRIALPQITSSQLATLRRCPRQAYYRYELCLIRADRPSYFRLGTAYHAGQEAKNTGQTAEEAIGAALTHYADMPAHYDAERWAVDAETVHQLLAGHMWRYADEPAFETVAAELSFKIPLVNPETGAKSRSFVFSGKIDAVVKLPDGRLAILEYKTCGEDIGPDAGYWLRLRGDAQISNYMLGARALGHDVQAVIYDVTRKPSIEPKLIAESDADGKIVLDAAGVRVFKRDGTPRQTGDAALGYVLQQRRETPAEFGARLLNDIGDRPDFYYARREVARTDDDLYEAAVELWQQAEELRERRRAGRWFRNVSADNCNRCDYSGPCLGGVTLEPGGEPPSGFVVGEQHPELAEATT